MITQLWDGIVNEIKILFAKVLMKGAFSISYCAFIYDAQGTRET